jgi:hypothetical protein
MYIQVPFDNWVGIDRDPQVFPSAIQETHDRVKVRGSGLMLITLDLL